MNELNTLQAEDTTTESHETDEVNNVETAIPNTEVDSAPAEQENKVTFDEGQQTFVNNLIGEKVKATRTAERKAERLSIELDEARAKIPQETRPNIPELPNSFDEDFEERMKVRDEALTKAASFDSRQVVLQEQEQNFQREQQFKQQEELMTTARTYDERATSLGISKQDLEIAGKAVASGGLSNEIVMHILNDDKGPLITDYLAKNPLDQDTLRTMSPMQAAIHLETVIKPKAAAVRKTTQAPDPATTVSGSGSPTQQRGPKGATYS